MPSILFPDPVSGAKNQRFPVQWRPHFRFRCRIAKGLSSVSGLGAPIPKFSCSGRGSEYCFANLESRIGSATTLAASNCLKLSPTPEGVGPWVP